MFATTSDPRFLPGQCKLSLAMNANTIKFCALQSFDFPFGCVTGPTDGSSKALHAGSMEDLQRHFFAIADPSDCTEAWVRFASIYGDGNRGVR